MLAVLGGCHRAQETVRQYADRDAFVSDSPEHGVLIHTTCAARNDGKALPGRVASQALREREVFFTCVTRANDGDASTIEKRPLAAAVQHGR